MIKDNVFPGGNPAHYPLGNDFSRDRHTATRAGADIRALMEAVEEVTDLLKKITKTVRHPMIIGWLSGAATRSACDRLPPSYVASQGTVLGRRGRVHVHLEGEDLWVGGDTRLVVAGEVALGR